MSSSKPKKLIHAEELIKEGKKEEALEIVLKFHQKAQNYLFGGELNKALELAFSLFFSRIIIRG